VHTEEYQNLLKNIQIFSYHVKHYFEPQRIEQYVTNIFEHILRCTRGIRQNCALNNTSTKLFSTDRWTVDLAIRIWADFDYQIGIWSQIQ